MAAFVTVLICSNFIGAAKVCLVNLPWIGDFRFSGGVLFFPISYFFGDILTEVYGYARARKVVWAGFGALAFASGMSWLVLNVPADPVWPNQGALETVFGATPRIVVASMIAYFLGEFCNSYTLAKMKVWSKGKALWQRTIGSTVVGEMVDSLVFYPLAFLGIWSVEQVFQVLIGNYFLKVLWEVLATPVTYRVVAFLKRAENEDYFDTKTKFTPFSLEV
ncbi:MAG: queuosine precursor transporter [Bacteriovoracia bacterium]